MTNYQSDVISAVKAALSAIGGESPTFKKVGEYPFDVEYLGHLYPAVLVEDGNESLSDYQENASVKFDYIVSVWLYVSAYQSRLSTILNYQMAIEDALLDDAFLYSLSTKIECIDLVSVEKGNYSDEENLYYPGYTGEVSVRQVNFRIVVKTGR